MRLLLVVCLLGTWSATFLNLINATTQSTTETSHTSNGTIQRMSSPTITPNSSTVTQATETSPASHTEDGKGKTSVKTEQPIVTSIAASTSSEATAIVEIQLTTTAPVTSLNQNTVPSVQPQNANASSAPHSTDSTASSMKSSPIQNSTGMSGTEISNITSIQSTTTGLNDTTAAAADSGQVALSSTQTPETSESTSFSSTATDITVIQATTAGPQTNETALQNTSTKGFSSNTLTNIPTTESKSKSTSTEAQDIVTTVVQKNATNVTIEVFCGPESSEGDDILEFNEIISCDAFVLQKGQKLGQLLCWILMKKQNIKGCSHCLIKLSKVKTSDRRLYIDISFKVDTNNVKSVLSEKKEELEKLGIRYSTNQEHRNEVHAPSELKKRIAMVVTGSLLLLILLSVVVYRCSQRKSHKKKDQYLTEETQPEDNGCHDNLAMDITECEPEMQEKPSSKVNMQDNMDNWIVPMDSLTKDEVEEEDTHL